MEKSCSQPTELLRRLKRLAKECFEGKSFKQTIKSKSLRERYLELDNYIMKQKIIMGTWRNLRAVIFKTREKLYYFIFNVLTTKYFQLKNSTQFKIIIVTESHEVIIDPSSNEYKRKKHQFCLYFYFSDGIVPHIRP